MTIKLMKLNDTTFFYGHRKIELVGPRVVITKFPGKLEGLVEVPEGEDLYRWFKALATGEVCTISGTPSNWVTEHAKLSGGVWQVERFGVSVNGDTPKQIHHFSSPVARWKDH